MPAPQHQANNHPDFEDDIPTGITHLPEKSQMWAWGLHLAVRNIRDDVRAAKKVLMLVPVVSAALVGVVEVVSWALQHVKLH